MFLFAEVLIWGKVIKTDINKNEVDKIIKDYVDKTYPQRIENYHSELKNQKKQSIQSVSDVTFVNNDLMWQDQELNVELKLNRLEFRVYCKRLNLAKRRDWRVPTYAELISLVDYTQDDPASIDKIKYIDSIKYWSSSKSALEKRKNWFVDFRYGASEIDSDLERHFIRCVRDVSKKEGEY